MSPRIRPTKPTPGLRERNRERTRREIQRAALRLFTEDGYDATTIEQICESAGVSTSTFFRYFPSKEELVVYDAIAPRVLEEFLAQPADLTALEAITAAMRLAVARITDAQMADQRLRAGIARQVPALHDAWLSEAFKTFELLGLLLADRLGRPADDVEVLAHAGALHGALLGASRALVDSDGSGEFATDDAFVAIDAIAGGLPLLNTHVQASAPDVT